MRIDDVLLAPIKDTLLTGGYNLLLGAGVSLDSSDKNGNSLPSGEDLRQTIVKLKGLKPTSSLSRAYKQLSSDEVDAYITQIFSNCKPGSTPKKLSEFVWKRIYNLNVDDSIEQVYEFQETKQKLDSFNHKSIYKNPDNKSVLQNVHIHGFARKPDDGYIFSLQEYAQTMGPGNAWVDVLSQTISSEPFIIAGTSLEEPDLEYFLSGRNKDTARVDRGPSFLVEPFPDEATLADCNRHGLVLYNGTLSEFLADLDEAFPNRPLPLNKPAGLELSMFSNSISQKELAIFSRDFNYLIPRSAMDDLDYSFYVGREPNLNDIALLRDISRKSTEEIKKQIRKRITQNEDYFLLLEDLAGSGKTTTCLRALFDLATEGVHVFLLKHGRTIDFELISRVFNGFRFPFVIFIDDASDRVGSILEVIKNVTRPDAIYIFADRMYRSSYTKRMLGGYSVRTIRIGNLQPPEINALISKMDSIGLTSSHTEKIAKERPELNAETVAVLVCRILHDFRPLDRIIESLLKHADQNRLERYAACCIASYCDKTGLPFNILTSNFPSANIKEQFSVSDVLPLAFTDEDKNFVSPANQILALPVIRQILREDRELVLEVYCRIGDSLAPYVNRQAQRARAPEARLAGRLFDYDEVAREILGTDSEKFYQRMQKRWAWNSRYWEQLALLKLDRFHVVDQTMKNSLIGEAVSHARHAVKVERHPLPLTTLGKVLLDQMEYKKSDSPRIFEEACEVLTEAIQREGKMSRIAIHPYSMLLSGIGKYIGIGRSLTSEQKLKLKKIADDAEIYFGGDQEMKIQILNVRPKLA